MGLSHPWLLPRLPSIFLLSSPLPPSSHVPSLSISEVENQQKIFNCDMLVESFVKNFISDLLTNCETSRRRKHTGRQISLVPRALYTTSWSTVSRCTLHVCVLLDGGSTKQMISVIVKTAAGFHALQSVCHTFSNGPYRVTEPNS